LDLKQTEHKKRWIAAFAIAGIQIAVAVFAVHSSNKDVLSDGACIGGIFGSLANIVVLFIALILLSILSLISLKAQAWHPWFKPAMFLCLSSSFAIWIGAYAALRCTV